MPIKVFGNSSFSYDNGKKIDTSKFVQRLYLRSNYLENNIGDDIDLRNHFRIKKYLDPITIREEVSKNYVDIKFIDPSIIERKNPHPDIDLIYKKINNVGLIEVNHWPEYGDHLSPKLYVNNTIGNSVDESSLLRLDPNGKLYLDEQDSILLNSTLTSPKTIIKLPTKNYVDNKFNDRSIIKNTAHVDFNDKNFDNVRFIKVNSMPAVGEHVTAKYYVDHAFSYSVDESSLLGLDPNQNLKLDEQDSIILNSTLTSLITIIELLTKSYVDSLHESYRNRRDLTSVFNDQDNEINNNKLTISDIVTVNRKLSSDNDISTKKYIDDQLDKKTILIFNQTLENYLEIPVGNDTFNLTKYDRIQIIDTTITKYAKTGGSFLQNWAIKCNDKNNSGKIQNFIKNQEKQTNQSVIQEQRVYLLSVIVLCILRQVLLIIVIMFFSASNEQILYKFLI